MAGLWCSEGSKASTDAVGWQRWSQKLILETCTCQRTCAGAVKLSLLVAGWHYTQNTARFSRKNEIVRKE